MTNHDISVSSTRTSDADDRRLSGSIGVGALVFMVLAGAAPLAVAAVTTPIGILVGNGAGYPTAYIVSAVILAFFAVGFVAMTPHVREAGAFYSYVSQGLGRRTGVGTGLLALLTYTVNVVGIYAFAGQAISNVLERYDVPTGTWWAWTAVVVAVVGYLGYQRIDLSGKVLGVLLAAEVVLVVVVDVAVIAKGGPEGGSTGMVDWSTLTSGSPALALMFAIGGFVGFEATAIYRDEARDPLRTIPRATYLALALIGAFYAITAWSIVTAWGDSAVVGRAAEDPSSMFVETAQNYAGTIMADVISILLVTSLIACALSLHNVISRYYFNLGNSGVVSSRLGAAHPRHGSPATASLWQSGVSVVLLAVCVALGLDPVVEIATWAGGLLAIGIVMLMLLTCLAVIVYFRRSRVDVRPWQTLVAPALGLIGLATVLVVMIQNLSLLMGGSDRLGIIAGVVLILTPVGGFLLAHLRAGQPGLGGDMARPDAR